MDINDIQFINHIRLERITEALERIATVLENYMAKIEEQEAHWKELTAKAHGSDSSE